MTTRSAHHLFSLTHHLNICIGNQIITCRSRGRQSGTSNLLSRIRANTAILIISSTNVPAVGSPNLTVIHHTVRHNLPIAYTPNPSTILSTLTLSNLPASHFYCRKFLPHGRTRQIRCLHALLNRHHAVIFCRAPRHVTSSVSSLLSTFNPGHPVTLYQRLAGSCRRVQQNPVKRVHRDIVSSPPHNRVMLIVNNTSDRRSRTTTPDALDIRSVTILTVSHTLRSNLHVGSTVTRIIRRRPLTSNSLTGHGRICTTILRVGK